ncbi:cupin domain-containing protein [Chitinimonas viridis]|uniref:Cupin domain-containing protein n=1 Tax=Chitinimonas viridis TaxID=664880 RepID=A0ABT8B9M4_9NEIS|nr:cupin domain-containing protein [Chitinimonas viridis]MDN3578321.1 cupin domain-containing protein [Chitinimonas viridis]
MNAQTVSAPTLADSARFASLVHPFTPADFLAGKWPKEFVHITGPMSRFAEIVEHPDFAGVESLLRSPLQGSIRADYTREDKRSEEDITPDRAIELYRAACTIYMTRLASEPILQWTRELDGALGLLPGTTQVNAFASMPGRGLSWHWDPQELFILQLKGRKVWHVAPNDYIDWPTKSGQAGAEKRPDIRMQLKDPQRPVESPKSWDTIEMEPGSVMFLPRGYWHTTENIDESLHLVFQVKLLSWRDVFTFLFESVPQFYDVPWRQPTLALSPDRLFEQGLQEFQERCSALGSLASPHGIQSLARLFGNSRA